MIVAARCGTLSVPENRAQPTGRKIDLYVAAMPARVPGGHGAPVFFIAGGPGGSTVSSWAEAPVIFSGLNDHHDIVLVDQRGTGKSHPIATPAPNPGETPAAYASRALASIDGDPRYYTTAVAMDDLDAVRQALGYSKIDLYGGSYGATAVQYYLRQHGDHVAAAVLDGGTLVNIPIFELIARNSQLALDDVLSRCAADSGCSAAYPNVRSDLIRTMNRLALHPVTTNVSDPSGQPIVLSGDTLAATIHQLLVASDSGPIPLLIHEAYTGQYDAVAAALSAYLGAPDTQMLVMSIEIMCSEAWARNDPANVRATGQGSYMLSNEVAFAEQYASACAWVPPGYVPAGDGQPPSTDVPVLLLNGSDDPQDPPANVAGYDTLMPNSLLVVAPGQGHTVGHLGCLPKVVIRFFDSGRADPAFASKCTASMSPPDFR